MNKLLWLRATILCVFTALSVRAGDTVHARGWIGGEFALAKKPGFYARRHVVNAFPASLRQEQKAGIFVRSVPTNSPAAQAGLRAGDLILKVEDQAVESLRRFHNQIEAAQPGQSMRLTVWRQGAKQELTVMTGRETYRHSGTVGFGVFFSTRLDLWPNPDFSLLVLGYQRDADRAQLHSPEAEYGRAVRKADGAKDDNDPNQNHEDGEGWRCWLSPFNLGMHHRVLSQELAQAGN